MRIPHVSMTEQVCRFLEEQGLHNVAVRAAGPESEIAVIDAPASAAARLAELAPGIRRFGFRYVTIDLGGARGDG